MVDRQKGELRAPHKILGKKAKYKLEWAYKGSGRLTVLPRSQYGTDISMEEFRDDLWWCLD